MMEEEAGKAVARSPPAWADHTSRGTSRESLNNVLFESGSNREGG